MGRHRNQTEKPGFRRSPDLGFREGRGSCQSTPSVPHGEYADDRLLECLFPRHVPYGLEAVLSIAKPGRIFSEDVTFEGNTAESPGLTV